MIESTITLGNAGWQVAMDNRSMPGYGGYCDDTYETNCGDDFRNCYLTHRSLYNTPTSGEGGSYLFFVPADSDQPEPCPPDVNPPGPCHHFVSLHGTVKNNVCAESQPSGKIEEFKAWIHLCS